MVSMEESRQACREMTRHHAKSFYFSSHTLPKAKREAAYALYAFCRHVDDAIDMAPDEAARAAAMCELRALVAAVFTDGAPDRVEELPWLPCFVGMVRERGIPRQYVDDLLVGVEMDQGRVRLETWPELRTYCYHVASVVGLMMTYILTEPREEHIGPATDLGIAMQLTNILRDVREDWDRDRVYLPAREMVQYGVSEEDIAEGRVSESWRGLMRFQVGRAREYYERAEPGIRLLPQDGSRLTVRLMRTIYGGILDEIERWDYDVFRGRAHVSTPRKLWLSWRAWRQGRVPAASS